MLYLKYIVACYAFIFSLLFFAESHAKSLYEPSSFRSLAADRRAHGVGDTLTIIVLETAQAESKAGTGAGSSFDMSANTSDSISQHNVGVGIDGNSDSTGRTARQGQLRAQLTVRVTNVDKQGQLTVHGEQSIVINGEQQRISIFGKLRSDDIAANNTVLSTRLSEAKIEFTGDGVVSENQNMNVFYRIFNWLGIL